MSRHIKKCLVVTKKDDDKVETNSNDKNDIVANNKTLEKSIFERFLFIEVL